MPYSNNLRAIEIVRMPNHNVADRLNSERSWSYTVLVIAREGSGRERESGERERETGDRERGAKERERERGEREREREREREGGARLSAQGLKSALATFDYRRR